MTDGKNTQAFPSHNPLLLGSADFTNYLIKVLGSQSSPELRQFCICCQLFYDMSGLVVGFLVELGGSQFSVGETRELYVLIQP